MRRLVGVPKHSKYAAHPYWTRTIS
jgi:hypothetical protein